MADRFSDLVKIPQQPAARLLANANAELQTDLDAPASAPVDVVLRELDEKAAHIDMMRLLSVALPARERVWWACLAARDTLEDGAKVPGPLSASEAWVFKPSAENRAAAVQALNTAAVMDETKHCALAVQFHDGTLGPGDLAEHPAPPGGSEVNAFAMNVIALTASGKPLAEAAGPLIERALDIARGGSGRIDTAQAQEQVPAQTEGA